MLDNHPLLLLWYEDYYSDEDAEPLGDQRQGEIYDKQGEIYDRQGGE